MPRVDAILANPLFRAELDFIENAEHDRVFCRHGIAHLLDVARVAQVRNLEDGLGLDRELIYAAALLHDIGRAEQYRVGTSHDIAGERVAARVLGTSMPARFSAGEAEQVLAAVAGHRRDAARPVDDLAGLIAWADHASRPCFACGAAAECYWPAQKKNLHIAV